MTVKATRQLRKLVAAFPNLNAAATAFGLESVELNRLLDGEGASARVLVNIMTATKLRYEQLFEHAEEEAKR